MQIEQSTVDALVSAPGEGLNTEVKRWIDPDSVAGIEKIVKAALALRNRNGGYLVIGFDNKSLLPDAGHEPSDVRSIFHLDKIQGIVSKYSSELFEIGIGYSRRDGIDHPVIVVPPGVRTPVAAKRGLADGNQTLVRHGAVYFRTLSANGTPSTAEARPEDWREIVEICFDNREADVGRFLRRQLAGRDVATLIDALQQTGLFGIASQGSQASPTLKEKTEALMLEGDEHFARAVAERPLDDNAKELLKAGFWTVACVVDPPRATAKPDQTFSHAIAASNPKYTGWPVWLDSSAFVDPESRPKVKDKAVEALMISGSSGWSHHFDFSRIDPQGKFYLRRVLQDDGVPTKVPPGTALDPIIVVLRVAEAIAVGISFAKALGWPPEQTRLGFSFRWQKLTGRNLMRWADPYGGFELGKSHDDEITTYTELSLDTPISAIAPSVKDATEDLFIMFDGHTLTAGVIEDWVKRMIERKLN